MTNDSADGPEPIYPPETIPTVFVDGVSNISNSKEVVKLYFARFDGSVNNAGVSDARVVAQAVMPMTSFINTALFFERALEAFVADGDITREMIESARSPSGEGAPSDDGE